MIRGLHPWGLLVLLGCGVAQGGEVVSFSVDKPALTTTTACQASAATAVENLLNGMVDRKYRFTAEFLPANDAGRRPLRWEAGFPGTEPATDWTCDIRGSLGSCALPNSEQGGGSLAKWVRDELLNKNWVTTTNKAELEKVGPNKARLKVGANVPLEVLGRLHCPKPSPIVKHEERNSTTSVVPIPWLMVVAGVSGLLFAILAALLWRISRLTTELRDAQSDLAARLKDTEAGLNALMAGMRGMVGEEVSSLAKNLKRQPNEPRRPADAAVVFSSPVPAEVLAVSPTSVTIDQQWLDLVNTSRNVAPSALPWRICGIDIANFDQRQLLPGVTPHWDILGETPDAVRRARFWLVGLPGEDFTILVPSLKMISERSVWMQGGSGLIEALLRGHYQWEPGIAFAAIEAAQITFDKVSSAIVVTRPGRLVLDLY